MAGQEIRGAVNRCEAIGMRVEPLQVAFTPHGGRTHVSLRDRNKMALFNTAARSVLEAMRVGSGPLGVRSQTAANGIVANQGHEETRGNSVSVVGAATGSIEGHY